MYSNFDIFGITVCAVMGLGIYIYLKATGELWNYVNWKLIWKCIRKWWRNRK